MKMYCLKCNNGTEYSDIKPKFCAFCQNPFYTAANKKTNLKSKSHNKSLSKLRKRDMEEEDDDEVYEEDDEGIGGEFYDFEVSKIEIEPIVKRADQEKINLADIILEKPLNSNSKKDLDKKVKRKAKRVSFKKFKEDWKKELSGRESSEISA